jgi:adenine-specific DNA-methyltransferase
MSIGTDDLKVMILAEVPKDGAAIGNQSLLAALRKQHPKLTEAKYHEARDELISEGELAKGGGRGGSVFRILSDDAEDKDVDDADSDNGDESDEDELELELHEAPTAFELEVQEAPSGRVGRVGKKAKKRSSASGPAQVLSYRHPDKRANNPEVGMVHVQNDPDQPKTVWRYDPHLDPALEFDGTRAKIEELIDDALGSGDTDKMRDALIELKRLQQPYLTWSGKAERTNFEVDTVSLHVHERIDPASILAAVRKRLKGEDGGKERAIQQGLFDAPFESLPLRQALDFYKHEKNWSNRLITGDSLLVMNSLLQKESMAGQVQMIYVDPPYGIKYGSNFQPFTNKRDVKDGADADLTQEPEMIKAFRDTWELGIHSYLTYLRDRLLLAKDLLHESGSVFAGDGVKQARSPGRARNKP